MQYAVNRPCFFSQQPSSLTQAVECQPPPDLQPVFYPACRSLTQQEVPLQPLFYAPCRTLAQQQAPLSFLFSVLCRTLYGQRFQKQWPPARGRALSCAW